MNVNSSENSTRVAYGGDGFGLGGGFPPPFAVSERTARTDDQGSSRLRERRRNVTMVPGKKNSIGRMRAGPSILLNSTEVLSALSGEKRYAGEGWVWGKKRTIVDRKKDVSKRY